MENYVLPVRVASTAVMLTGVLVHSTVILLSGKRYSNENNAYVLFMRIYSCVSVLRLVCGWMVISRSVAIPNGFFFISYGIASLGGSQFCNTVDAIGSHLVTLLHFLVPLGMLFRALICCQIHVQKGHIFIACLCFWLICVSIMVIMIRNYTEAFYSFENLSREDQDQLVYHAAYALSGLQPWEGSVIVVLTNASYVSVPLTFLLAFVAFLRLKKFQSHLSSQTSRIHSSFIKLLSLEALSTCIGFVLTLFRLWNKTAAKTDNGPLLIANFYSYPLLALIPTIQGCATLFLVPYFRGELLYTLRLKKLRLPMDQSQRTHSAVTRVN